MKNNRLPLIIGGCVVLLLCCCLASVVGWFMFQNQISQILGQTSEQLQPSDLGVPPLPGASDNTPSTSGQATVVPTKPAGGNPLDALTNAFRGWGNVKSFRARISAGGAPEMTLEVVTPDRIHMTSQQVEMILIGNTSYMKIGGQWQKMNLPQSIDVNLFNPKTYETEIQGVPDIKVLGPEVLDGTPTIVYQFGTTLKGSSQATTTKVWVGVADGFPHKIESGNATITFYDFNANITITPPIP